MMFPLSSTTPIQRVILLVQVAGLTIPGHSLVQPNHNHPQEQQQLLFNRRDALISTTSSLLLLPAGIARAADDDTTVDMDAINAARSKGMKFGGGLPTTTTKVPFADAVAAPQLDRRTSPIGTSDNNSKFDEKKFKEDLAQMKNDLFKKPRPQPDQHAVVPIADPPPKLTIRGGLDNKADFISMPRIGYSLYQTPTSQTSQSVAVALRAGVRHLDLATQYGNNNQVVPVLQKYLSVGPEALTPFLKGSDESIATIDQLDNIRQRGEEHGQKTLGIKEGSQSLAPPPSGSVGRRGRRDELFLSYKISNTEQSTDASQVRRTVKTMIGQLGCSNLDLVSLHSPITSKEVRLASYEALLDLRGSGFVQAVGVCNFGVDALKEILNADLDLPAVNQLELTPFNQHIDVVEWCDKYGVAVSCSAVGVDTLSQMIGGDRWDSLVRLAASKGMTPNQVIARWAIQKGFASLSSYGTMVDCSYGGLNSSPNNLLTPEELKMLDGLDVACPAGRLGRMDGWEPGDVKGDEWDPTQYV